MATGMKEVMQQQVLLTVVGTEVQVRLFYTPGDYSTVVKYTTLLGRLGKLFRLVEILQSSCTR